MAPLERPCYGKRKTMMLLYCSNQWPGSGKMGAQLVSFLPHTSALVWNQMCIRVMLELGKGARVIPWGTGWHPPNQTGRKHVQPRDKRHAPGDISNSVPVSLISAATDVAEASVELAADQLSCSATFALQMSSSLILQRIPVGQHSLLGDVTSPLSFHGCALCMVCLTLVFVLHVPYSPPIFCGKECLWILPEPSRRRSSFYNSCVRLFLLLLHQLDPFLMLQWLLLYSLVYHRPLLPPYLGPYRVLQAGPKFFSVDLDGQQEQVSVDCLKPQLGSVPLVPTVPLHHRWVPLQCAAPLSTADLSSGPSRDCIV